MTLVAVEGGCAWLSVTFDTCLKSCDIQERITWPPVYSYVRVTNIRTLQYIIPYLQNLNEELWLETLPADTCELAQSTVLKSWHFTDKTTQAQYRISNQQHMKGPGVFMYIDNTGFSWTHFCSLECVWRLKFLWILGISFLPATQKSNPKAP